MSALITAPPTASEPLRGFCFRAPDRLRIPLVPGLFLTSPSGHKHCPPVLTSLYTLNFIHGKKKYHAGQNVYDAVRRLLFGMMTICTCILSLPRHRPLRTNYTRSGQLCLLFIHRLLRLVCLEVL